VRVKNNLRAVLPQLSHFGYLEYIPLHATSFRNTILWEHLEHPGSQKSLDQAAQYFGTEMGFYFAYLAHYTTWMTVPATLGVCLYIADYHYYGMSPYAITYVIFLCIWMAFYLKLWSRWCNFLRVRWGVMDFKEREILQEPRDGFHGYKRKSPISGKDELHSSGSKRYMKIYLVSAPITLLCLYISFFVVTITLTVQDYCEDVWICRETPMMYMPSILYSICIPVLDLIYSFIAMHLTEWENYKTRSEHRDALIVKLTCFKFINNYLILFYIYFWLRDLSRLKQQLQTLMISTQISSFAIELGVPYMQAKYKIFTAQNKLKVEKSAEKLSPKANNGDEPVGGSLDISSEDKTKTPFYFSADMQLSKYPGLMSEYFGVLRDHGYAIMFGWCWGLAPLCALLANCLQLRFDMWKICTSYRRPIYSDSDGIGAWETVLRVYSILFTAVIFSMLAMYELVISYDDGEGGAEPFCHSLGIWAEKLSGYFKVWPTAHAAFKGLTFLENTSKEVKLMIIVFIEHMVLATLLAIRYIVPSIPGKVAETIRRQRYVEHMLVKQQLQHTSSRKLRNKSYAAARRASMHFDKTAR